MSAPLTTELRLAPCPFCGKLETVKLTDSSEYHMIDCECQQDYDAENDRSYAVVCDASKPKGPGGCGASGGFAPTRELAVERWNLRSAT